MGERKMDKRIQCPVCDKEGVLQWKETITKAKGKTYRYKKLYIYHWNPKKPKWCYLRKDHLEDLQLTQNTELLTQKSIPEAIDNNNQNKLKNHSFSEIRYSATSFAHEPVLEFSVTSFKYSFHEMSIAPFQSPYL